MSRHSNDDNGKKGGCLGRRDFLRLSGAAVSGIALSPILFNKEALALLCDDLSVLPNYNPGVTSFWVPKGEQLAYYGHFKSMIEDVTDFSWLGSNDKVMIKLALNSGELFPATTDPWLLDCMIRLLIEKGAKPANILVGDQSGVEYVVWTDKVSRGSSRAKCEDAGLLAVIEQYGATPVFYEERITEDGYEDAYVMTYPEDSHIWPKPIWVTSYLDEVDHIIYLPRVSSHQIADVTSGMKIGIGFLRDDSRLTLHQGGENFYAMYEEVNHVPQIQDKLRLIASSGRSVLRTRGPDSGDIVEPDYGLVFASADLLAHEILAYSWLKMQNNRRTVLTPTMVNQALVSVFFARVPGGTAITPRIPALDSNSPFCHPAVVNFMQRMGGRPNEIVWNSLNENPDASVTRQLNRLITY